MRTRKIKHAEYGESTCPHCSSKDVNAFSCSDTIDFRGLVFDVEGLQKMECRTCRYVFETELQATQNAAVIRSVYSVERDKLRAKDGLLSGAEIAEIRNSFDLSQREAAAVFGGGYNAFNKYESGEVLQSVAMDRLLRLARAIGAPAIQILRNPTSPPKLKTFVLESTPHHSKALYFDCKLSRSRDTFVFLYGPEVCWSEPNESNGFSPSQSLAPWPPNSSTTMLINEKQDY